MPLALLIAQVGLAPPAAAGSFERVVFSMDGKTIVTTMDPRRGDVETRLAQNEAGRLRIGGVTVRIAGDVAPEDRARVGRCMGLFEDFCVVTQSVRGGIPVDVAVEVLEAR
jgi:organic hydroperoxide reductase OsmC/OhrA